MMIFSGLLQRFRKKQEETGGNDAERVFAMRHHIFKLFLKSWNKFQETMTDVEYTLCCDHPFGLYRVHELCCSVATQVFQCIHHLERLDAEPCANLKARFDLLQKEVAGFVYPESICPVGPLCIALGTGSLDDALRLHLIDPATARLEKLRVHFPNNVPQGFVLTQTACQHFFGQGDLLKELARRTQAAGGYAPLHLAKLSETLGSFIENKELPDEVRDCVLSEIHALRGRLSGGNWRLLLRGRLWPVLSDGHKAGDMRDPGLLLWGPAVSLAASDEEILHALVVTLARKYRAQALIYRRARGLTDCDAGYCVACLAVEEPMIGGLAHTGTPLDPEGRTLTLYACAGLPQEMEYSTLPVETVTLNSHDGTEHVSPDAPQAPRMLLTPERTAKIADFARKVALDRHWPLSLTFVMTRKEDLMILLARPLHIEEPQHYPHNQSDAELLLAGGMAVSLGRVSGRVIIARSWEDVRHFPPGGILVVPDDQYTWVSIIDRAAGIIAEKGVLGSRLGSLAREFGKPALFGMQDAMSRLTYGQEVTLCVDQKAVYAGHCKELLEGVSKPCDHMVGSPVWHLLQHAAERILPFTMDVDSVDFRSRNCRTYHDIARFCHERAVSAMFSLGAAKKYAPTRVKQLVDEVPKQFWVVNLSNGFATTPKGPFIDISEICSVPMAALWRGMNAFPWEGPPPVDGKGFLSVLFEATANPNLEPSAQTSYFSEKNYFLISRDYASLHSRFGFHFVSVEANLGERSRENSIVFQLRGGAADIERRMLRVRFVSEILWEFGFASQLANDALVARIEGVSQEEGIQFLYVCGYLTIHTRQLDMIMQDRTQVQQRHDAMISDCRSLFTGKARNL